MATYTDVDAFRRDVWQVTSEDVSPAILSRAATMAYNKINAVLSGVYSVPFSATYPPIIVDISDMLTKGIALALSLERGSIALSEDQRTEYQMAVDELREIVSGGMGIVGQTRLSTRGAYHNMEDYRPIFDLDSSLNHRVDVNYLEDVATDRRNT